MSLGFVGQVGFDRSSWVGRSVWVGYIRLGLVGQAGIMSGWFLQVRLSLVGQVSFGRLG